MSETERGEPSIKKRYRVLVEMEGWGKDGSEIIDGALWEEVDVEAATPEEATEIAANKDFGNRRVASVEEPKLISGDE